MHVDQFGMDELKEQLRKMVQKRLDNCKYWMSIHREEYGMTEKPFDAQMIIAYSAAITELNWMLREIEDA
jgi:hypothetical protein